MKNRVLKLQMYSKKNLFLSHFIQQERVKMIVLQAGGSVEFTGVDT